MKMKSCYVSIKAGTADIFSIGGGEGGGGFLKESVGRSVGTPKKILKSRGSEMLFSAFSIRYFFKKVNLDQV